MVNKINMMYCGTVEMKMSGLAPAKEMPPIYAKHGYKARKKTYDMPNLVTSPTNNAYIHVKERKIGDHSSIFARLLSARNKDKSSFIAS